MNTLQQQAKNSLVIWIVLITTICTAQNYTGIWQGYITASEDGIQFDNSGYALNIKSHQNDIITGSAYIYGRYTLKFEGLLDFIGTAKGIHNKPSLTELKVLRYKTSDETFSLCVKLADMTFTHKNGIDYLSGEWNGSTEKGSRCAPGKVYLQRYNPEDPDGISPIPDEVMNMIREEGSAKMSFLGTELADPVIIPVSNTHIQFEIGDYMREDMDTVSVYLNRKPLISNLQITKKIQKFSARLDKRAQLSEIIMHAENLGRIPPNTSNLTIIDGKQKHRILIQSTKEKSAVIYLKYAGRGAANSYNDQQNVVNKL